MSKLRSEIAMFTLPALGLLVAGCQSELSGPAELTGAESSVEASHSGSASESKLRLSGSAVLVSQTLAPDFGPPVFGRSLFGGRCSVPSDFVIAFAMVGQASHLGRFTADLEHCTRVDFTTGLTTILDGIGTFTAANGDELWDRYERLVPGSGSAGDPEHHRFIGGTGRFLGATGEGLGLPRCNRAAGTCEFELEGVIVYDASDRSG